MIDKQGAERRRYTRYEVQDTVFITIRPQFDRIGWLTDISKGGVAFEYLAIQDYSAFTENSHLDIFSSSKKYDLSNLPCQMIYDARLDVQKGFMENIEIRRCGLVFGEISHRQSVQLDVVLSQHMC
jgi:hypothetical protein